MKFCYDERVMKIRVVDDERERAEMIGGVLA